jgi:hypothetical protein
MMFVVKLICRVAFRSAVVLGVFLAWLLLLSGTLPSAAQGWQWPAEMRLGGFYITGIQGNVNRDGSGSATGTAQIPGIAGQKALLTRSANGEISAEVSLGAKISGVELVGIKPWENPERFVEEFVNAPRKLKKMDIDVLKRVLEEEHEVR